MKTVQARLSPGRLPRDYAALCRMLTPRPIHDKVTYENVVEITDAMAGHKLSPDQLDYFDLLCRLIEDYEKENELIKPAKAGGIETLRHLLESRSMNASDLSRLLGVHRNLGGMILRGERKLTLAHVKTVAAYFGITADAFLN